MGKKGHGDLIYFVEKVCLKHTNKIINPPSMKTSLTFWFDSAWEFIMHTWSGTPRMDTLTNISGRVVRRVVVGEQHGRGCWGIERDGDWEGHIRQLNETSYERRHDLGPLFGACLTPDPIDNAKGKQHLVDVSTMEINTMHFLDVTDCFGGTQLTKDTPR